MLRRLKGLSHLLKALWVVAVVRVALSTRKTSFIKRKIGKELRLSSGASDAADKDLNADLTVVSWSVSAASRLVPGATCLTQAYAGAWLLAKRARSSEIKITLPHDATAGFRPHAWLMHEQTIILGGTPTDYLRHRPLHQEIHNA